MTNSPHKEAGYRSDIDGLRAIAVLSVVVFHALPMLMNGGFIGVDIFFVISGYLITGIILKSLDKGSFSFSEFYGRRVRRIFPALIVMLVACYGYGWFSLLADEYKQLGKHIAAGAGFMSNFVLLKESGYFDVSAELKPLLHLWSLGIEEQFYLLWPLLMFVGYKLKFSLSFIIFILVASFAVNVAQIHSHPDAVFYLPFTRFWELLIGSLLAFSNLRKPHLIAGIHPSIRNAASFVGLALIGLSCLGLNQQSAFPGWWALWPTLGAVLLIAAGSDTWLNRKILSHPILVWFGLISYPLYLWHWPVLYFMPILVPATYSPRYRIVAVLVSILLAWLTYRLIERPIRFGGRGSQKAIVLTLLMAVVGSVGYYTYKHDGLAFRRKLPPFMQELVGMNFTPMAEAAYRLHKCLLDVNEDSSKFSKECLDENKKPLVFLWGDSFAAALYPGLQSLQDKHHFGIAQFTASQCPPLVTWSNPKSKPLCKGINEVDMELIKKIQPDIVVLHSRWKGFKYDLSKIDITVSELRKIGIKKIVLIGPVPEWHDTLRKSIVSYWMQHPSLERPPVRMNFGTRGVIADVDKEMSAMAERLEINYISAYQVFCNEEGCLTRVGDNVLDVTSTDYGHLTPQASRFLAKSMYKDLFESSAVHPQTMSPVVTGGSPVNPQ